jgi:hypothetical protein
MRPKQCILCSRLHEVATRDLTLPRLPHAKSFLNTSNLNTCASSKFCASCNTSSGSRKRPYGAPDRCHDSITEESVVGAL